MASKEMQSQLATLTQKLKEIDVSKLIRANIGDESLKGRIEGTIDEIKIKLDMAISTSPGVPDGNVQAAYGIFSNILTQMNSLANRSNAEYVNQKEQFLVGVNAQLQQLLPHWVYFVSARVESSRILESGEVQKLLREATDTIDSKVADSLKNLDEQAKKILDAASAKAVEIEKRARKSAEKTSLQLAQEQFLTSQKDLKKGLWTWGSLAASFLIIFLAIVGYLLFFADLPASFTWQFAYHSIVRSIALGVLLTLATYCIRMFSSYLHMYQHNEHRIRITNCIPSFVDAALTDKQSDIILARLVESVSNFGESGILKNNLRGTQPSSVTLRAISNCVSDVTDNR